MIYLRGSNTKMLQIFSLILYIGITIVWVLFLVLDPSMETLFGFLLGCGGFGTIVLLNLNLKQITVIQDKMGIEGPFSSIVIPIKSVDKIESTLISPPLYKVVFKDGRNFYFTVNKELMFKMTIKIGENKIIDELNKYLNET